MTLKTIREALIKASSAINTSYMQAQADYQGFDKTSDKHGKVIDDYQELNSKALSELDKLEERIAGMKRDKDFYTPVQAYDGIENYNQAIEDVLKKMRGKKDGKTHQIPT